MLLGNASVDKNSFIKRYCYNLFNPSERLTIGIDFHVKIIELQGKKIKLQIWDVGGEERFRFLLPTYCLEANGALLLFDVTRSQTLDNIGEWTNIVHQKGGEIPIMLVGILPEQEMVREVSEEKGKKLAKSFKLSGYIECDPKTGKNINKAFESLVKLIINDDRKGRKKKEQKNRSQFREKVRKEEAMDKFINALQIPEEGNKETQPRLSDEDIRILDLEGEEGIKLIKRYQEQTNRRAIWKGKETIDFVKWLKGEKVVVRNQTMIDSIKSYLKDLENDLKSWETKDDIDNLLHSIVRFILVYGRDYRLEFENFIERISKWQNYDENEYPYSEILKAIQEDSEYRRQFLLNQRRDFKNRERYPYPYVFKPPEPPDDLALAPRAQIRQPTKKKDRKVKITCQYCGIQLTKEDQLTHSCQKKPKN